MKKRLIIACLSVALATLVSCVQEQDGSLVVDNKKTLSVEYDEIKSGDNSLTIDSKTFVKYEKLIQWGNTPEDKVIYVFDSKGIKTAFNNTSGVAIERTRKFSGTISEDSEIVSVIWTGQDAAQDQCSFKNGVFSGPTLRLKNPQIINNSMSFDNAANIAVMKSEGDVLTNVFGYIKCMIPEVDGAGVVKSMTFSADQPLSGEVQIDYTGDEPVATIVDSVTCNSLTVSAKEGSRALAAGGIFVVLPAGTYTNFKISVTLADGTCFDVPVSEPVIIERGKYTSIGSIPTEGEWNPTDEELFADDYFDKFVDPISDVVSYWFKTEVPGLWSGKRNTQSTYFVTKSMTNDKRFCYFFISTKEENGNLPTERCAAVFDFKTRKIYTFPGNDGGYPYLDSETDQLYYYEMNPKNGSVRDGGRFFRKDLLKNPDTSVPLTTLPPGLAPAGCYINRALSHITLTQDKQWVFMDSMLNSSKCVGGMLNIYTGEWREWYYTTVKHLTHGQINPVRDDEVLLSRDVWGNGDSRDELYNQENDGVYERINVMTPDGNIRVIDPRHSLNNNNNYASHEMWHYDGDHVYWCANGVNIRNIRTGEHEYAYRERAVHANLSYDMKYIALDNDQMGDTFRGGRWRVTFFNRETGKKVNLISLSPAITTEDKPSRIHPDPHPHFVCNDKYVVCTMADADGYLRWSITPVDQLIRRTLR